MNVYASKYLSVDYYDEYRLIEATWSNETINMTAEEYKTEFLNYLDIVIRVNSIAVLADESRMSFNADPTLQQWVNENIFPKIPPQNLAVIVSQDLITKLAAEQLMDEAEGRNRFQTRFFEVREEGREWLISLKE
jgi:hypothetical protein